LESALTIIRPSSLLGGEVVSILCMSCYSWSEVSCVLVSVMCRMTVRKSG
jgi:hypothetical protein